MVVKLKQPSALGSLSLTPLIDVVFLLLVFFLVATRFAQEEREMDLALPTASEAMPMTEEPKQVFIDIDENGQFFIDNQPLTVAEIENSLRQVVADNPLHQKVYIRADRNVKYEAVVAIMNVCNLVGATYTTGVMPQEL
ncbi:MAG: biopolymer transporter ExbD [Pirellulaceae bacterium]|nr:biopolymer transporter ExbD [Pirellulaceae bacterium]